MKKLYRLIVVVLLGLMVLSACAPAAQPGKHVSLDNSAWVLEQLNGQAALPNSQITLQFSKDQVSGSDGCNRYQGFYEIKDNKIKFSEDMAVTLMACDQSVMDQGAAYLAALKSSTSVRVSENTLELLDAKGKTLAAFKKQDTNLSGTSWQVTAYNNGKEAVVSVLNGTEVTLQFGADDRLNGSAGCNTYNAGYTITGSELKISAPASTRMACAEPEGVMEQEAQYLAALEKVASWQMEGSQLRLLDSGGATLVQLTASK